MRVSERGHAFVAAMETLPRSDSQGLHARIFDSLDTRVRVLDSQARACRHARHSCRINEEVGSRLGMRNAETVGNAVKRVQNVQAFQNGIAILADRGNSYFDADISYLLQ